MKQIMILGFFFGLMSCTGQKNNDKNSVNSKINGQPIYTIKISVANPYEIYVNDMPVEKFYSKGSTNSETPINDFILNSGINDFKIILLPDEGKSVVDKSGIDYIDIKICKYPNGLSHMGLDDAILVKSVNLKDLQEAPIIIKSFQVDINVPYKQEGWAKSVDLSKENQENLKREVLSKYEEIRNVLNDGNYVLYDNILAKKNHETYNAYYNNLNAINEDEDWMKDRIIKSKGNMKNIEIITMHLCGNSKVVYLENSNHESPLIAVVEGKYEEVYNIILHRPFAGAPLEVIR